MPPDPNHCPVETTLGIIGGRWKALILFHLAQGPARFNVLRRLIPGVTQRMLTAHLRELEADGVVDRRVFEVVPPHVEYSLTDLGRSLSPILDAMAVWGMEHEQRQATRRAEAA
jgi:DNA-binding HxlR family transcriptional regulator